MTRQEKAKELVERFYEYASDSGIQIGDENFCAKQCALIHVNGIIEILSDWYGYHYGIEEELNFYIDVRDEIEKL